MFDLPSSDEKEFNVTKEYADVKLTNTTLKKLKAAS
jgi:ATP-dependent Clp protease ATP-binding subunit ClpX